MLRRERRDTHNGSKTGLARFANRINSLPNFENFLAKLKLRTRALAVFLGSTGIRT